MGAGRGLGPEDAPPGRADLGGGAGLWRLAVARDELEHALADPGQASGAAGQNLGPDPLALPHQAQQDVLGAYVVVAELQGLA